MKILLAVDGSQHSSRSAGYVVRHRSVFKGASIDLLHVQPPLPGRAAAALSVSMVQRYYRDEGRKALAAAGRQLARARMRYTERHLLGDPGATIARYAKQGKYSVVIMGSHGRGALSQLMLGSAVQKVLARCKVPVLIIR